MSYLYCTSELHHTIATKIIEMNRSMLPTLNHTPNMCEATWLFKIEDNMFIIYNKTTDNSYYFSQSTGKLIYLSKDFIRCCIAKNIESIDNKLHNNKPSTLSDSIEYLSFLSSIYDNLHNFSITCDKLIDDIRKKLSFNDTHIDRLEHSLHKYCINKKYKANIIHQQYNYIKEYYDNIDEEYISRKVKIIP